MNKQQIHTDYLPEKTAEVFEKLSKLSFIKKYTLVGGTALSLQIKHRLSEDLDFIFDGEELNINTIKRNIDKYFKNYRIIRIEKGYQIDFVIHETKVTFFSTSAVSIPFRVMDYSLKSASKCEKVFFGLNFVKTANILVFPFDCFVKTGRITRI